MHLRGTGYALTASLMFGFGVVLAKLLSGEIDAVLVAFLCLLIGGLLLTMYFFFTGNSIFHNLSVLTRADWINIFLLSCIGTALPLLLIVAGFTQTSALEGGFVLQLNGMAALIFALLLLHERFNLRQGLGIFLLLVGSMLVVLKGFQGGVDWESGSLGNLLILAGAIGLGFGFIPAKRLAERVDTLQLTALRLLLGAATLLPIFVFQILFRSQSLLWQPSFTSLWALPAYILTSFCLGYLSQQAGFHLLKAWEMATIMQTVPLFSTIFAVLMLHDTITPLQAAGGFLAVLGGIIASLSNKKTES
ncbi:MAG TPA: DMT family transporter, partial [Ktedonobacteraceae bacterium]|nr:DMT family transporter [Ktedonobacteraceae bacterium]